MSQQPNPPPNIDSVYYRDGVNNSLAMRVLMSARMSMFELFMREMAPTAESKILDIGVSDDENDGANFLEKLYPWQEQITCAGIGNGEAIVANYPQVKFCQIQPNEKLPFADGSFDIACSNAVIEHVGGSAQRTTFILEHLRVAKAVFITFPNRWFPVEHHTSIPFLHYSPSLFRSVLKGTRYDHWVDATNMDFIDRSTIHREWPAGARRPALITTTGIQLGPFSSNIAVIVR